MRDNSSVGREEETGHVTTPPNPEGIWRATLLAGVVALILNLGLYFIGREAGWIPEDIPESTEAFSLVSVVFATILPVVIFGGLMVYLDRVAPRASRLFTIILLAVLIIAVMVPFLFRDLDGSFRTVLVAMHFVAAASILSIARATER